MKNIKKIVVAAVLVTMLIVSAVVLSACKASATEVVDYKLTDEEYAFCVKKGDAELLKDVNGALEKITKDGTVDKIMNKYFNDGEIVGYESPAKDSSKKQLLMATNAAFAPFEYKEGNKFCGIDVEMMLEIAKELDMELVIEDMDFDAVITAVGAGTSDIGAAGLTVTEKRKESVDFTNTYYQASQMVIVNKGDETFKDCKSSEDVIAVIKAMKDKKAGFQNGTTGEFFIKGNDDFEGFDNITAKGYPNAGLAVKDMINGNIDFVVVDELPAKAIVKKIK